MNESRFARVCLWLSRRLGGRSVFGYRYVSPIETMLGAYMGLAALAVVVQHADRFGELVEGLAEPLRFLLSDVEDDRSV